MSFELIENRSEIDEPLNLVATVPPPPGEADAYSARTQLNPPSLALIAMMAKDHASCDELEKAYAATVKQPPPSVPPQMPRLTPLVFEVIPMLGFAPQVQVARKPDVGAWLALALAAIVTAAGLTSLLV